LVTSGVAGLFLMLPCLWFLAVPVSGLAFGLAGVGSHLAAKNKERQGMVNAALIASGLVLFVSAVLVLEIQGILGQIGEALRRGER
jgi:hypothetical protein